MTQRASYAWAVSALAVLIIAISWFSTLPIDNRAGLRPVLVTDLPRQVHRQSDVHTDSGCQAPTGWSTLDNHLLGFSISYPSSTNVGAMDDEPDIALASEVSLSSWTPDGRTSWMRIFSGDAVDVDLTAYPRSDFGAARDLAESARRRYSKSDDDGLTTLNPTNVKEVVYHGIHWYVISFHLFPPGDNATSQRKVLMFANHPAIPVTVGVEYVDDSLMSSVVCTLRAIVPQAG